MECPLHTAKHIAFARLVQRAQENSKLDTTLQKGIAPKLADFRFLHYSSFASSRSFSSSISAIGSKSVI